MRTASIELVVRLVVTERWPDGTSRSWAHVTAIDSGGAMVSELALGDHLELARALGEAKWRGDRIRVPPTFFTQDEATRVALLQKAVQSSPTQVQLP